MPDQMDNMTEAEEEAVVIARKTRSFTVSIPPS
jgi:hypothetical protein